MATIFGTNLASATLSGSSPWPSSLGGTEVHLVVDEIANDTQSGTVADCTTDCELVAPLIYVSPTQINFLVPDLQNPLTIERSRVVFIQNGVRYDARYDISGGVGLVYLDPVNGDPVNNSFLVFQVGYDCLFSYSLTNSSACGLSWTPGQYRVAVGAVTDAVSYSLINSQNPVHQGQLITLWGTALGGLSLDSVSGLLQQPNPTSVAIGLAQTGQDIPSTLNNGADVATFYSRPALWAGESPQYVGLDQVNLYFPTCTTSTLATVEQHLDAFLLFENIGNNTATNPPARIYLPFDIRRGDPDCGESPQSVAGNLIATTTQLSVTANSNASFLLTAAVSPPNASGAVSFYDGSTLMGVRPIAGGTSVLGVGYSEVPSLDELSGIFLTAGSHSVTATYDGSSAYATSSTAVQVANKATTTTTLTSSLNPAQWGQAVTFTAAVAPSAATGTVTFSDNGTMIGTGIVNSGITTWSTSYGLGEGSHLLTATYSGDGNYNGSSSGIITQIVEYPIVLTSTSNPSTFGESVGFTATTTAGCAVGGLGITPVTFYDGATVIGIVPWNPTKACGSAGLSTSLLSVGTHAITATIDISSSPILTQVVTWAISLTSSPNPSTVGQSVAFTACGFPSNLPGLLVFLDGATPIGVDNSVSSPCSTFSTGALALGTHAIMAQYQDSAGGNISSMVVTQVVNQAAKPYSSVSISDEPNPATYSSTTPHLIIATVLPSTATGTVQFFLPNPFCTNSSCQITCIGSSEGYAPNASCFYLFPAGTYIITVVYNGDLNVSGSTASLQHTENLLLTSSMNPSSAGGSVTFTATGAWGTGIVAFYDGTTRIAAVVASNGQAAFSTTGLSAGTHSITAVFTGNTTGTDSSSMVLTQAVTP